ncbi:MAG: hypothetical protein HUJ25_07010 [Crocinitomicaceae bacterium]|nr:hypothetical protein [Crocinitomicaceae bacterium]
MLRWKKMLLLLTFVSFMSQIHAQIVTGNENKETEKEEPTKEKKEKKPREKVSRDSLTGTTYYLTGLYTFGHRYFQDNSISQSYSEWENQLPGQSGGGSFGILFPITNALSMDLGFTFFGHTEQYLYSDEVSDSTFSYSNTYVHIGMPVKLRYTYGDKLQVFGFAGLTPLNVVNIRYNENYTRANGTTVEKDVEVIKEDKLAIFNLMASAGIGLTYNFEWFGITLYPEYRHHLFNTYNSQRPFDHKMYGLGVNLGLTLRF